MINILANIENVIPRFGTTPTPTHQKKTNKKTRGGGSLGAVCGGVVGHSGGG